MSLRNILQKVATKTGADLSNQSQLDYLIAEINDVASDEYAAKDFPNSLVEQRFYMTADTELVRMVLPAEVGKLRATRYSDLVSGQITLVDMRPRYYAGNAWTDTKNLLKFEVQADNAPCKQEIANASRVLVKLKKAETFDVNVTLAGRTDFAEYYSETVTITAGETQKYSESMFEEFTNISKKEITNVDVTVEDLDGVEISEIKSYYYEAMFTIVQVSTRLLTEVYLQPGFTRTIELLYKRRWRPMVKLEDEFMCPGCDNIIAWKYLADYASHQEGQEQRAILADAKGERLAGERALDDEQGKLLRLEGLRGSGLSGFTRMRNSRRGYGWRIK